jgi:ER-bound oxygenase mpaB/B'/Rubber oxygenase, catalytic domain
MTDMLTGHAIYRQLALFTMPDDIKLGMNLAFYRTFAAPRIAEVLAGTGEIAGSTIKRADDTGLIMYLLIYHGLDHPDSQVLLERLRKMHHRQRIDNDDYIYALGCLAVVPTRWIARYGPRPLNEQEIAATYAYYSDLGERMGATDLPGSYSELEAWFDAYDQEHLRPTPAGRVLLQATRGLLVERFPPWAQPLAGRCSDALLDDRMREVLGVGRPGPAIRVLVAALMRVRAWVARRARPRTEPAFTPDTPVRSYPNGYDLRKVGPADIS